MERGGSEKKRKRKLTSLSAFAVKEQKSKKGPEGKEKNRQEDGNIVPLFPFPTKKEGIGKRLKGEGKKKPYSYKKFQRILKEKGGPTTNTNKNFLSSPT